MHSARRLTRDHLLRSILLSAVIAVAVAFAYLAGFLKGPEHLLYDLHFHWRGRIPASDQIVLVLMRDPAPDAAEAVLRPGDRTALAAAAGALCRAGAAVVGIDMLLASPGPDPAADRLLAETIAGCGNVVLARVSTSPAGEILPMTPFAAAMIGDGFIDLSLDRDEVLRRMQFLTAKPLPGEGLALIPSFALEVARVYRNVDFDLDFSGEDHLRVGTDPSEQLALPYPELLVDFSGDYTVFDRIGFADAAQGRFSPSKVAGKVVLIGSMRAMGKDFFSTPYTRFRNVLGAHRDKFGTLVEDFAARQEPGVACHAHAVETILRGSWIRKCSPGWAVALLAACALAGGVFFFPGLSLWWALLVLIAGLAGLTGLSHLLFAGGGRWLEIVPAAFVFFGQFTAGTALQKVYERRRNTVVTGLFGKYVSPAVATEILQTDLDASMAGQRRVVSILFSDLRDFTAVSETLGARRTGALLNAYFGAMLPLVFRYQGTLDKLIGDAVMAFFGAPLPLPDHPVKAAQTALAMTDALGVLKQGPTPDAQVLKVGIGINTGEVTVGNLGSEAFMDYTIIGDAVNLASRLEGLNKIYGTRILLSESSAHALDRRFVLRQIDRVRVKGRAGAVTIFELLGDAGSVAPEQTAALHNFAAGLRAFRERSWDRAAALFRQVLEQVPADGPSKLYLERIARLQKAPTPPDWDGVSVYTEK